MRIDGNFIRVDMAALDFKNLIEVVIQKLPSSLVETTDLLSQEFVQIIDKKMKKEATKKT